VIHDGQGGRVLVLQHIAAEGPGVLGGLLTSANMTLTVVELDDGEPIPPLLDFDLMLVMGGPMDVWQEDRHPWLAGEKTTIRRWVRELGRPYLGVCLGHQLLAAAAGGAVGPMPQPEIGVMEMALTADGLADPVFALLPQRFYGLQWHGAQVLGLPDDGVALATNRQCAMQAIRIGSCAWGVQFHLEADDSTVTEWAKVPEYSSALADMGLGGAHWLGDAVAQQARSMQRDAGLLLAGILGAVARVTRGAPAQ
jgi:GMP synthase-like glutamine amidotransferase